MVSFRPSLTPELSNGTKPSAHDGIPLLIENVQVMAHTRHGLSPRGGGELKRDELHASTRHPTDKVTSVYHGSGGIGMARTSGSSSVRDGHDLCHSTVLVET